MAGGYRFRTDPALIRLVLAYAERFTVVAAAREFDVREETVTKWRRERRLRGADWPTLDDDRRWLEATTSGRAQAKAEAMRRYRDRREANGGEPLLVDPLGTQRRIRALVAIGHSTGAIAAHGGWSGGKDLQQILARRRGVTPETRDRVAAVYADLHMTPGISLIARRHAERAGWPPPLAWDDIDDPHELPSTYILEDLRTDPAGDDSEVDEVVVLRILMGDDLPATRAERFEVIRRWDLNTGLPRKELSRRMGWKPERYGRLRDQVAS